MGRRNKWRLARLNRSRQAREFKRRAYRRARRSNWEHRRKRLDRIAPRMPNPARPGKTARTLLPPVRINLRDDYAETVTFLKQVRHLAETISGKFLVDFTGIQEITAAGALLMVAEFDRWRELVPYQWLNPVQLDKWNPSVRKRLTDMGFFDVMRSRNRFMPPAEDQDGSDGGEKYLKFSSGHKSEGEKAKALREAIEELGPILADRSLLFEGLTEAMTNVDHHAYRPDWKVKRWWMSASVDATGRRLRVMFVDHGVGIPRTLPKEFVEEVRSAAAQGPLNKILMPDARLIKAAVSDRRTKTMAENRGWGLKQNIRGYIDQHEGQGSLRIISGHGQYVYTKETGKKGKISLRALPVPFEGTFIEWIVEEYAARSSDE